MSSAKIKKKTAEAINLNVLQPASANKSKVLTDADFERAARDRAIANEIALLALAGHAVQKCKARDFIVSKYDTMTMYCEDFAALQAFSRKVGASK
jgi:hypothetical protein